MLHEFSEALKSLAKRPGFALLVVVPLALGIGATSTVFSAVYGVLLKAPDYREPERLMQVWERRPRLPMPDEVAAFSTDHFRQWRDANRVFEGLAMYGDRPVAYRGLAEAPGEPRPLSAEQVSPELFEILGVSPQLGRAFRSEEATPGRDAVAVLGHAFWTREFGGDPAVLGKTLRIDDRDVEIIGVAPPGFGFPIPTTEIYLPYPTEPPADLQPGQVRLELVQVVGRLRDGVSIEQAESEAAALIDRLSEESEIQRMLNEGVTVHLSSFTERSTRRIRQPLIALFGVTLLVLLIVCGNVANLLLTRAAWRQRELAVRSALGAGRTRLLRRLFAESLLLAGAAGIVGTLLAVGGAGIVRSLTVLGLPQLAAASVDARVVAFTLAVAGLAALVFGTLPALRASSRDPAAALDASARGDATPLGGSARGIGRRGLFAALQLALALPLLIGAGLLTRSFLALVSAPPGYEPSNTAAFEVQMAASRYPDPAEQAALFDRIRESLAAIPGVTHVGIVDTLPLSGERAVIGFQRIGEEPVTDPNQVPRALLRRVSPGYFRAMGIPLREGRVFEDNDRSNPGAVSVVNESLVERYLSDPPVGLELRGMGAIVGVVGDVHEDGVDSPTEPVLYVLDGGLGMPQGADVLRRSVVLRHAPGALVLEAAAARLQEVDPELAALSPRTLEDRIRESVAQPRLYAILLGAFALAAALLAAWGVFGVVGFQANARIPAHGVRMAFGATPGDIRRLVLGDALRIAALGLVPGLLLVFVLVRVMGSEFSPLLFEITPLDPVVYVVVPLLLFLTVVAAAVQPASTAARLDVVPALRSEHARPRKSWFA
jgi:putative ABC transport system permease protein